MTLEITSKNYPILMSALTNRTERVEQMIQIYNKPEEEATRKAYEQELKDIVILEEDIRTAFMTL